MIVDQDGVRRYFGKYRGKVSSTRDSLGKGRIQVTVAHILENPTWAMPCVPFAASGKGFYVIPPEDADVWVEFEEGLRDFPVWTGCFWGTEGSAPNTTPGTEATTRIIKLDTLELKLVESSNDGEIDLKLTTSGGSVEIKLGADGIGLDAGSANVTVDGVKLSVNDGALEVQ